jgi:hypothetical protein
LGAVVVAGTGTGAAGEGGGGLGALVVARAESMRALSAPSVVDRVLESAVESLAATAPGASAAPFDLK